MVILALLLLAVAVPVGAAFRGRSLDPRLRLALGVLIPLVLALLAWDVSFQPLTSHQDFYLGPANDIRHGRYMLVDDYSQYGVAVIYFLAALLAPLPFGYGTLVLVVGLLTSLLFAAVYVVLRVATRSLAFAALGTFVALMASTIATIGRSTQYPSTGFLRFGIPWLLVCALVVAHRGERPARTPTLVAYALVGVAAIWSFETAFYTGATFAVTVVAAAWTLPAGQRLRCAATHLGLGAAAAVVAIAGLVAATAAGRGRAPDIGGYLDFLRLYSVQGFGAAARAGLVARVPDGRALRRVAGRGVRPRRARAGRTRARLDDRAAGRGEHARRRLAHVLPGPLASQQPHARGAARSSPW